MDTAHIRIVYPKSVQKGLLRTSQYARAFITFPDGEERELPAVRAAKFTLGIDEADHVSVEFFSTVEVQYGD